MIYRGYTIKKFGGKYAVYKWADMLKAGFATDKEAREWIDERIGNAK